ncbi:MAG: DnaA regulatory inactivator Hda [Gammaproteobacteria bacterium]|nr:DnaA regulatory inactivator Hda [Gammaproteobacteria bacterium]
MRLAYADLPQLADFAGADNGALVQALERAAAGQALRVFIWGPARSGRTHLLQAACAMAAGYDRRPAYVPLRTAASELLPEMLEGLEHAGLVCIDDIDAIAGLVAWEVALLGLYNRTADAGHALVLAASAAPRDVPVGLADLKSRLGWGPCFRIAQPDDDEKLGALQRRAARRGFDLPVPVARFMLTHCPRDFATLLEVLARLDEASLAAQRRLSIPFVRSLLGL